MVRGVLLVIVSGLAMILAGCGDVNGDDALPGDSSDASQANDGDDAHESDLINDTPEISDGADVDDGDPERLFGEEIGSYDSRPIMPWYMHPPVFHVATDKDELETGWEMYQLEGDLPDVDWDQHEVVLAGLSESGSCPWKFEGFSVEYDELIGHLDYDINYRDDDMVDCTADDNPRTHAIRVDAGTIPADEPIVRLAHTQFDSYPMRTDTRDIPLKPIDATKHDYPFEVWSSESLGNLDHDSQDRVLEWAEVIAIDERSIALRFGFNDRSMAPDIEDPNEFELLLPDPSYVSVRVGMTIHDASFAFDPPENPEVYTAPYREIAVAGRDFHQIMARPMLMVNPHLSNVDEVSSVQVAIPLQGHESEYEWDVSFSEEETAIELVIMKVGESDASDSPAGRITMDLRR